MDVRQLAFLACQPSAALQSRESFWGLPKRGLAFVLANAIFWQPLLVQAEGIVVSAAGTSLGAAGNGIPIVNIAAPNGSGLSHNQFKDYNVGANGVILNNATHRTQSTQLGGIILGNPNLAGNPAHIILNEVNGGSPSQLRGYTEVAGQSARVIVANPYGITCNGCGFINTPTVTVTTGRPILDNGRLDRYQVDGGAVTIDGQGLNAGNIDRFEIITRSARINGQINARHLTVIAGRNDVNAQTLHATARADDGSARPELAIDSSVLGGMYAGAIRLVGTEAGVGVKLDGTLAASGGDIQLDVNGQLTLSQTTAKGGVTVKAKSLDAHGVIYAGTALNVQTKGDLNNRKNLIARDSIKLSSGGQVTNSGIIEAGVNADETRNTTGDVRISAQTLSNTGNSIIASRNLTANVKTLNNQGGTLSAKQVATLRAGTLDNQNKGRVLSSGRLELTADQLLNSQGGRVSSDGALTANVGQLNNRNAEVSSLTTLTLNVASLDNVAGLITAGAALSLTAVGTVNNQGGELTSQGTLTLEAGAVDNSNGEINAEQALSLNATSLDNSAGSVIGKGTVTLDLLGALINTHGKLASGATLLIKRASRIDNRSGTLASEGLLTLLAGSLDNRNGGTVVAHDSLNLDITGDVQNSSGLIHSQNADVRLTAASLDNAKGTVKSQSTLTLNTSGDINNQNGTLTAQTGEVNLSATNLDNRGGSLASLESALKARVSGALRNGQAGVIEGQWLDLGASRIDNSGGRIAAQAGGASVTSGYFDNRGGTLYGKGAVKVTGHDFDNSGDAGGKEAGGQIEFILKGALDNRNGVIESASTLSVSAHSVDNRSGQLRASGTRGESAFEIGGLFDNRTGMLETANNDFSFEAGSFQNTDGHVLHVGKGTFGMALANLDQAGGSLVTHGSLTVDRDTWTNSSAIQAGRLTVNVNTLNQTADGQLLASEHFTGKGINWTTDGLIASDGDFDLTLSNSLKSRGRATSGGEMNLQVGQLNLSDTASLSSGGNSTVKVAGLFNNSGRLTSASDLNLSASAVNNHGALGSAQNLTLTTGALLNEQGLIFSGGDMGLRVDTLKNSYADIYSLGNLVIDRDGQGGLASSIINSSANIQSDGQLSLAASTIQNVRAILTTDNPGIHTARIGEIACIEGVNAGDCRGKQNHVWEIVQRDKLEVTEASAASSITSGGDLTITAGDLLNQSSTIATAGNLVATVNNLINSGIETGATETTRVFMSQRTRNADALYNAANAFTNTYWFQSAGYNPEDLSGLQGAMSNFIGKTEIELAQLGTTQKLAAGDQRYAAVIQAGGAAQVTVGNKLDSSVVRPGYTYVGSGPRTDTNAAGADFATRIALNQQLPPDLAQQQVNPLALPGFTLPSGHNGLFRLSGQGAGTPTGALPVAGVQGLPDATLATHPQKYLIETNPLLTDLKQFMGSDYLLSSLGYDPDQSHKRLGDGLYEQRLIQQAIIARTGQRFIDGQTSDAATFKYLMDNAIASKQALNLAVGVSLTSEQVAALTHDLVWLENATVNGEPVLVPVLYLAQADHRLAPNGALIAGNDVKLIAGKDLNTVGTLRATNNLSAQVDNHLTNNGLIEAGQRLDLRADHNLTNQAGGVIAGRDVNLTAVNGDLHNERTVTRHQSSSGYRIERSDFVDNAARIEAANHLTLQAGRDINNVGGVMHSGADTVLKAGRDVNLIAAQQRDSNAVTTHSRSDRTTQYGSVIEAGRDFQVVAARDISAVASQIEAQRDIGMAATGDLLLAAAANEQHSAIHTKKVKRQEDHVSQVSSTVTAGGDVRLSAGQDLALIASQVTAGDEAYLVAGNRLDLLAAQDRDYSLYDMKKKGRWGSKQTQRDEITHVSHVGSAIKTGADLTLESGGDQHYQAAKLDSGKDLALAAGGAVTFEAVTDLHQESHEKSDSNAFWVSSKGKGHTDETLRQSQLIAEGNLAINAVDGLTIDIRQVDPQTVSQSIDAMVQADPQLAWLKEAEQRGNVDWRQVKEIHDSFNYSHSGLGPASQIIIAIVMAAVVGPTAMGAMTGATGAAVTAGTLSASTAASLSAAAGAVAAGAATNASVSAINNRGDLGAVFKDVTSSDAMKGHLISGVTAGLTASTFNKWTGAKTHPVTGKVEIALDTWKGVGQFAANQTLQSSTSMALSKALGRDGSAGDALKSALFNTLAAASFNAVGDYTQGLLDDGSAQKIAVHAMVGGLLAEATGGDFKTGALAAGANEALVSRLNHLVKGDETLLTTSSQIVGVLAAAAQQDSDAAKVEKGAWVARNATQYNYLAHHEAEAFIQEARECSASNTCDQVRDKYADLNDANDKRLRAHCEADPVGCFAAYKNFVAESDRTQELISQARVSGDIPGGLKHALGAVQLFNVQAKTQIVAGGIATETAQSVSDFAAGLGFDVEPETVGSVAAGVAILAGAGKGSKGAGSAAYSSVNGLKLSTQLAYEDAGILTRGGTGLTQEAVTASREIPISGGRLTNPAVVKALTANGSKIEDWGKFTTPSITLPSGQRSQVHYYMNKVTGELNLNIDFKVKGGGAMKVIAKPSAPSAAGWLDEGENLTVLAMSAAPLEGVKYLLWSAKQETVALFPGADFDVVDRHLSRRWIFSIGFQGGFDLGPEAWQVDGFWERYHDGDSIAEQVFEEEKSLIFSEGGCKS